METNNSKNSDFDRLLKDLNRDIFNKELSDIIEVTYAYADLWNGKFLNKTLFWTLLWREYIEDKTQTKELNKQAEKDFWKNIWENIAEVYAKAKSKLLLKKSLVIKYKELLQPFLKENTPRVQILLWSLEYVSNILDLTITGLPFEAQKAWIPHNFSQEEISERVKKLEEIETKLFGWNVRENEYEVRGSFEVLTKLFEKQKTKLTSEEQERFASYLQKLKQTFSYITDSTQNDKNESKNSKTFDILSREIPREDYVKVLKLAMEIYWIEKPVIIEERSSIYDGEDYLGIPESDWYKTLKLTRVLQLIQHEIETHYIIEKNNSQTLWKFRGSWNLQREEWTAKVAEWTLQWKTLDSFWIQWALPDILFWEILSWDDYKDYLELFAKMDRDKMTFWLALKDPKTTFLRRKRNYPLDYKWVQHKDTSYNRWERQVVNFLQNNWDVKDLYIWKVSFEDIAKTKEIVALENIKIMYPLLIWELLQYTLLLRESWMMQKELMDKNFKPLKFNENDFWDYIERKYPFLNIRQEIANWTIERFSLKTKLKIGRILNILK